MAFGSPQWIYNAGGFEIPQSLRIDNTFEQSFLKTTLPTVGDKKTWTYSTWVKRSEIRTTSDVASDSDFFAGYNGASYYTGHVLFDTEDKLVIYDWGLDGSGHYSVETVNRFTDVAGWYHVVIAFDTTEESYEDRIKIWVNGAPQELQDRNGWGEFGYPTYQSHEGSFNSGVVYIGCDHGENTSDKPFNGYVAESHFIDGQALTPDYFGEFNTDIDQWVPIKFRVTTTHKKSYGANGFYLDYEGGNIQPATFNTTDVFGDGSIRAFYKLEGNFNDETGNYNGTANSATWGDAQDAKFGSGCFYGDGASRYGLLPRIMDSNFSWSFWVRFDNTNVNSRYFGVESGSIDPDLVFQITDGNFGAYLGSTLGAEYNLFQPEAMKWYHIVAVSGVGIYVNGNLIYSGNIQQPGSGGHIGVGCDGMDIGEVGYLDGAIDQIRIFNRAITSTEVAKLYNEGGYLPDIGKDVITGTIEFELNGISANNVVPDSPTNNFPTWDSTHTIYDSRLTEYSHGALRFRAASGNGLSATATQVVPTEGKWYFEHMCEQVSVSTTPYILVSSANGYASYRANGQIWIDGASVATVDSINDGDIIGVLTDVDNTQVTFYKNGTSVYTASPSGSLSHGEIRAYVARGASSYPPGDSYITNFGQDPTFCGRKTPSTTYSDISGRGQFYHSVPTGAKAICTTNYPDPTIVPKEHFTSVMWGGNQGTQVIQTGFQPDFAWLKSNVSGWGHSWIDVTRTTNPAGSSSFPRLSSNLTAAELQNGGITSWGTDRVVLNGDAGYMNRYGHMISGWFWKGGNGTVTNTDGTFTATVSANPEAGFSIMKYNGNQNSGNTVGHGLNQAPEIVICKAIDEVTNWSVNGSVGSLAYGVNKLVLQSASGVSGDTNEVIDVNSTTITLGSSTATNNQGNMVAYAFHSVPGFSKIGTYSANGNDGPKIVTGFQPAWVMVKRMDSTEEWMIIDTTRDETNDGSEHRLFANTDSGWSDAAAMDIHSNGFKMTRTGEGTGNVTGGTYLYIAFAEQPFKHTNARATSYDAYSAPEATYEITKSLRFEKLTPNYLQRAFDGTGNRRTWTWAGWVKRDGRAGYIAGFGDNLGSNYTMFQFDGDGKLYFLDGTGSYNNHLCTTKMQFLDYSAWYHIVVSVDTTLEKASERVKLYANGKRLPVDVINSRQYPQNFETSVSVSGWYSRIGVGSMPTQYWAPFGGLMADVYFIDGQALSPEAFGYWDEANNSWKAKEFDDGRKWPEWGSNGYNLKMNDYYGTGTYMLDHSPMSNDHTSAGFLENDLMFDTPTNNICCWNYADNRLDNSLINEGMMRLSGAGPTDDFVHATHALTSGKWYFEVYDQSQGNRGAIGIHDGHASNSVWGAENVHVTLWTGAVYVKGSSIGNIGAFETGDVLTCAVDFDAGTVWFGKNGAPDTSASGYNLGTANVRNWRIAYRENGHIQTITITNFGQDSSFSNNKTRQTNTDSNGKGNFQYAPPTGFLCICDDNLPSVSINPREHFGSMTWVGDGSQVSHKITGLDFTPGMVWVDGRSGGGTPTIHDVGRGESAYGFLPLHPNYVVEDQFIVDGGSWHSLYGALTDMFDGGFTVKSGTSSSNYNTDGLEYSGWCWNFPETGTNNTNGDIQSTVHVNYDAAQSIVTYTGNGTLNATVGHGLPSAPDVTFVKRRDIDNTRPWAIEAPNDFNGRLLLSATTEAQSFSHCAPYTDTVLTLEEGSTSNTSGGQYVAYCFTKKEGYFDSGTYYVRTGGEPVFVNLGFKPAYVIIKNITSGNAYTEWCIYDSTRDTDYNPVNYNSVQYWPSGRYGTRGNGSAAGTFLNLHLNSNGFYIPEPSSAFEHGSAGDTYFYMAWAESPFKGGNAV